jgi:hypothetical protein
VRRLHTSVANQDQPPGRPIRCTEISCQPCAVCR